METKFKLNQKVVAVDKKGGGQITFYKGRIVALHVTETSTLYVIRIVYSFGVADNTFEEAQVFLTLDEAIDYVKEHINDYIEIVGN